MTHSTSRAAGWPQIAFEMSSKLGDRLGDRGVPEQSGWRCRASSTRSRNPAISVQRRVFAAITARCSLDQLCREALPDEAAVPLHE